MNGIHDRVPITIHRSNFVLLVVFLGSGIKHFEITVPSW